MLMKRALAPAEAGGTVGDPVAVGKEVTDGAVAVVLGERSLFDEDSPQKFPWLSLNRIENW